MDIKYTITKEMEIAGQHRLNLPYESKCRNNHGHNWMVYVTVSCLEHDLENDMVIDFAHIKREIHDYLDHGNLNELLDFNPTAENIARWIMDKVDAMRPEAVCEKVEIHESRGNVAVCEKV